MKPSGCVATFAILGISALGQTPPAAFGLFESHGDVGAVLHEGSAVHDAAKSIYTLTGSGENMWSTADEFQFVWKKVSGDVSLAADISFPDSGGDPHKKAVLIIRQSLDPDSAYADVALHGNGLTSLQARDEKGAATHEIQSNTSGPKRIRLQKIGQYFYMSVSGAGDDLRFAGGSMRVKLEEPFFVGIGMCAHNKDVVETAVFSKVELVTGAQPGPVRQPAFYSTLETITVASTDRRVVRVFPGRIEAPNWTPDGASLLFNGNGRLQKIAVGGGDVQLIDTDFATRLTNDHGISPDGTLLAISDQSQEQRRSLIYTVPIEGGPPTRITKESPSYWHGWSPDGKTLVFVGDRNGNVDIYTIPVDGGDETRLTTAEGIDDGPEFSPDGAYVYFNSDRTGTMQIWRMRPDGSRQEQVTSDEYNNWFPHISPDGRRMAFLTYGKDVIGHPENKDVMLRIMTLNDLRVTVLANVFGGQGTITVSSWSPDSKRLAFVSYQFIP
ncbi:MAG: putative beta-propeller-type glycoside hydrolase [Bryobacterales bacterium]|nr:putative beta-propeller-type glycoside hydrolase [Bryobacterales bacterium]